jgi:hypothetical protein
VLLAAISAIAPAARAGLLFGEPDGGWDYLFDGDTDERGPDSMHALDGTWRRDESSEWDANNIPGDAFFPPGNPPGGIVALEEDATTYLRIQDTGFTDDWDYPSDDNNNNDRFWLGRSVGREHPGVTSIMSEAGITITFRARIASTGLLDPVHPQTSFDIDPEQPILDEITPWFPKGYHVTDEGEGMFTVEEDGTQNNPDPGDDDGFAVGFALALDIDTPEQRGPRPNIPGGLVMNNRPGYPQPGSDRANNADDIANVVPMDDEDLLDWHEWWITIEGAGMISGARAYDVNVYRDGMLVPDVFLVRQSITGQYTGQHIAFGLSSGSGYGAVDVDFFGYKLGVHTPVPEAGASTAALAALAALALARRLQSSP